MSGHTTAFHLTDGVRTLVYEKSREQLRIPEAVLVSNLSASDEAVTIEWVRYDPAGVFFITNSKPVPGRDTTEANLRTIWMREGDQLYVTVSGGNSEIFIELQDRTDADYRRG